jgi:hypothetical protein
MSGRFSMRPTGHVAQSPRARLGNSGRVARGRRRPLGWSRPASFARGPRFP